MVQPKPNDRNGWKAVIALRREATNSEHMSYLSIDEMKAQVPEGQRRTFERSIGEETEERYFQIWQNWDYRPGRLEWLNRPSFKDAPRIGIRGTPRRPLAALPLPDVKFKGHSKDVVDFYDPSKDAPFVSERLYQLIEEVDPGSLDQLEFQLRAKDNELPFRAIMSRRVVDAIDMHRTTVHIGSEYYGGFVQPVLFPDGIVLNNDILEGAATFSDSYLGGWFWSAELIELAKARGIRGLYAKSVASPQLKVIARL